jgi:hypothetical protein
MPSRRWLLSVWRCQASAQPGKLNDMGGCKAWGPNTSPQDEPSYPHVPLSVNAHASKFFRDCPPIVTFAGAFCAADPCMVRLYTRGFGAMTPEACSVQVSCLERHFFEELRRCAIEGSVGTRASFHGLNGVLGKCARPLQACARGLRHALGS